MGLFSRVLAPFQRKNTLSSYGTLDDAQFWTKLSHNYPEPGQSSYLHVMAALRAGMVIAQGVGQVGLHVKHEKLVNNQLVRRDAIEDRSYALLNRRPNDWMTSVELREALTLHAVFTGAGRAIIRRGVDGRPLEILPLHPRWVDAYHDETTGEFIYRVGVSEYGIYGTYSRDDIIEVTNPRWDFVSGLDVTRHASQALGLSSSLETRQARTSQKNAPYGIISSESNLSEDRVKKLKAGWVKQFGEGNGVGILDFSAKFQQMMGTAQDQQIVENRKFQVEEVARAYGVFPQMLMASDTTTTFASAESFFNAHLVHTMQPWFNRWEQAIDRALFDKSRNLRAQFDERELIRMSPSDRAEYLSRALGSGGNAPWYTQNEARMAEGLNPIAGGDVLINPNKGQEDGNEVPEV